MMVEEQNKNDMLSRIKSSETRYRPEDKDVRWLYDYKTIYFRVKAALTGGWLTRSNKGEVVIEYEGGEATPCMNKIGMNETLSLVSGWITEIQGFSYYPDEERIMTLCRSNYHFLGGFYRINMEKFNLTPEKAKKTIKIIIDLYEANLRRSLKGRSLNIIGSTEKTVITKDDEKPGRKWLPV